MEKEDGGTTGKPPQTASLFPVFHQSTSSSNDKGPGGWLQNASFSADVTALNNTDQRFKLEEDSSGEEEKEKDKGPQYELVNSSPSDPGSDEERRRNKRKKKKKRKMELSRSFPDYAIGARKPDVRTWAASSTSSTENAKEYYFDSRGDRDNLAFGYLYRMDIARYKSRNTKKISDFSFYRRNHKISAIDGDHDVDGLDDNLRMGGRYWSAQYAALERHRNLKRIRVIPLEKTVSSVPADFVSLMDDGESDEKSNPSTNFVEESWEDEVFRKTKEYNKLTREKPHDEKVWLAFADFQDKVSSMQPQKGARLQTLEKKISILEKATQLNPDSEDLLLSLLKAYQCRDSIDILIGRWENILVQNSGNYRLWREFLRVVQGEFSGVKMFDIRKFYANAVQALSGACGKLYRQVCRNTNGHTVDRHLVELELGLVDIFLHLCLFEWQAGYREMATALFQAEIEYALFCPSLLLSEQSKQRLFEHFWNSNGVRVGEDGALGWATWLTKEEEQRQKVRNEELSLEAEEGGWTGWSEMPSKTEEGRETEENDATGEIAAEDEDEDEDEENDDTETLLKKLGIDSAAAGENIDVKDIKTWTKWSREELARDCSQWMPVRAESAGVADGVDAESDEQFFRVIVFEDVTDYLFSLISEEAQLSLVSQFIQFFGGIITQWFVLRSILSFPIFLMGKLTNVVDGVLWLCFRACTNSMSWYESIRSLEAPSHTILDNLRKMQDALSEKESHRIGIPLEGLQNDLDECSMRASMMKFVRNATLLCLTAFPQNYILEEAVLIAEELSKTRMSSSVSPSVTPCRTLAKGLLKSNRQDVLLCGVYARREAAYGNLDHARKIFDMALSSIQELPSDAQSTAALLYLWYAEMEIAESSVDKLPSSSRAMHILSCLGCGVKYSPFRSQPSSLQLLRARQGFKERIRLLGQQWTRGRIDDFSNALICSAALFEELTTGPTSAIEILEEAFSMVLPEKRRHSQQLEALLNRYLKILCEYHQEMKLANTWEAIVKGLHMYPSSPHLYSILVGFSLLHTSSNKLRLILDEFCFKKPSLVACFFSLAYEMGTGSSKHRIRAIFERALNSDKFRDTVLLWRWYIAYENSVLHDFSAARRVFFRAIHTCPWSKTLWLDGFVGLSSVLTVKELSDLQEVMKDKELNLRTDIYEILLQDEMVT